MRRLLLATISLLQAAVQARNDGSLESRNTGDICTIFGQSSAIVGGQLFFARGSYSFDGGDTLTRQMNLYSLNLSSTFQADAYISSRDYKSITLPSGVTYTDDWQTFLYDNTTLYFYVPDTTTGDKIWSYNVSTDNFQELSVAGSGNNPIVHGNGAWVSNPATGHSYYTGTPSNGLAKRSPSSPSLQVFDSSTSNIQWQEGTGGGPLLSQGAMVYVRAGKAGVLVAFGGVDPNDHSQFASSTLGAYRPMTDIFVFDIHSSTWYNVTASGANGAADIPEARISFCAVVSSAPDDSSFQITIYGGYNLHDTAAMNTVYVLTLPTFQWIDVTSYGNTSSDAKFNVGRQTHQCLLWQDTEMIVLGGRIQGTSTNNVNTVNQIGCNSSHPPLLILDTTTFEWQQRFSPSRSYSQPEAVYNVLGGDYRGGNSNRAPPGGFNNSDLATIFSQTVSRIDQPTSFPLLASSNSSTASTTLPATITLPASTASSSANPGAKNTNVSAIAGSIVGVIIILVAIAGFIFIRRKRKLQPPIDLPKAEEHYLGGQKPELSGVSATFPSEMDVDHAKNAYLYELNEGGVFELPGDSGRVHEMPIDHSRSRRLLHGRAETTSSRQS